MVFALTWRISQVTEITFQFHLFTYWIVNKSIGKCFYLPINLTCKVFSHDSIYIVSFHETCVCTHIDIINDCKIFGLTIWPCFNNLIHMVHSYIVKLELRFSGKQSCCAISELRRLTNSKLSSWPFLVNILWGNISHFTDYRWTGHNLFSLESICTCSHYRFVFENYLTDFTDHFTSQQVVASSWLYYKSFRDQRELSQTLQIISQANR